MSIGYIRADLAGLWEMHDDPRDPEAALLLCPTCAEQHADDTWEESLHPNLVWALGEHCDGCQREPASPIDERRSQ